VKTIRDKRKDSIKIFNIVRLKKIFEENEERRKSLIS